MTSGQRTDDGGAARASEREGDAGRLLLVGLDAPEADALRARLPGPRVVWPIVPRFRLVDGVLEVESASVVGRFLPVSRVIFHGVFADDLPLLTALALWRGPCLPSALGLLDCRERIPALARALAVTRFGALPRGLALPPDPYEAAAPAVAKWGVWHCGEDKARFAGRFEPREPSVVEPFVEGTSVRIALVGDRAWQVRMAGDGWLRSIHHPDATLEAAPDPDLLADARALARRFDLAVCAVDYQVAPDGTPHLLEVNHAPNVTAFPALRAAFLDLCAAWAGAP